MMSSFLFCFVLVILYKAWPNTVLELAIFGIDNNFLYAGIRDDTLKYFHCII